MAMEMEQVVYCLCLFLAPLLPLLLLNNLTKRRANGVRLPPSPWRLPVIGNLHQVMRSPLVHRTMADLARRLGAPLMHLRLGEVPVVVASSPEAAREVLRTHDAAFAARPWSPTVRVLKADGPGLGLARGALWRTLHRACAAEILGARRVRSSRRAREEEAARLAASVAAACAAGEAVNVGARVTVATANSAARLAIGAPFERLDEFLENFAEGSRIIAGLSLADLFPSSRLARLVSGTARRAEAIRRKDSELMDSAIRQHEERRAAMAVAADGATEEENLVDVLLRVQKEGDLEVLLTMGIIKAVILDFLIAGSDTSAHTLQWAMSELMKNPRVMCKAQAEIRESLQGKSTVTEDDLINLKYIKLVVKETLRMHPVVPLLLPRECQESCKIMGYDIPKGTNVFVNVWAISRDPKYWDGAETFKPERFEASMPDFRGANFEFTPFGSGRRMCPGMTFALASMELLLATLLYHFDWKLLDEHVSGELDMIEEMGITLRRKNDLYLRPIVYVPLQAAP